MLVIESNTSETVQAHESPSITFGTISPNPVKIIGRVWNICSCVSLNWTETGTVFCAANLYSPARYQAAAGGGFKTVASGIFRVFLRIERASMVALIEDAIAN